MVFARVANKLPGWAVLYPFESMMVVVGVSSAATWTLATLSHTQPLAAHLQNWSVHALSVALIVSSILLASAVRSSDAGQIAGTLYTLTFLLAIELVLLVRPAGVTSYEFISLFQLAGLSSIAVFRASHLRAAARAQRSFLREE